MKCLRFSLSLILSITIAMASSLITQSGRAQKIIDRLATDEYVMATAGMGNNEVTIITLTDADSHSVQVCRQALPDHIESCLREVEARGMFRREWIVNCRNLWVRESNYVGISTYTIDPYTPPFQATYRSYVIYDYACGTQYSE
jgi:hypothetical protein